MPGQRMSYYPPQQAQPMMQQTSMNVTPMYGQPAGMQRPSHQGQYVAPEPHYGQPVAGPSRLPPNFQYTPAYPHLPPERQYQLQQAYLSATAAPRNASPPPSNYAETSVSSPTISSSTHSVPSPPSKGHSSSASLSTLPYTGIGSDVDSIAASVDRLSTYESTQQTSPPSSRRAPRLSSLDLIRDPQLSAYFQGGQAEQSAPVPVDRQHSGGSSRPDSSYLGDEYSPEGDSLASAGSRSNGGHYADAADDPRRGNAEYSDFDH